MLCVLTLQRRGAEATVIWHSSYVYSHLAFKLRIQSSGSDVAESGPDDYRVSHR